MKFYYQKQVRFSFIKQITDESSTGIQVDQQALDQLLQMGFPEPRCIKALVKTGNSGAEMAMSWLFEHMDDLDIDDPLPAQSESVDFDPCQLEGLTDMGFTLQQAKKAMKETVNS